MMTYAALLRGINVGKAKRVAMADLRRMTEALGYTRPRTLLNSGNLVFEGERAAPATLAATLEEALKTQLGVTARIVVLTVDQLTAAIAENPLPQGEAAPSQFLLAFPVHPQALPSLEPLLQEEWSPEAFALGNEAAYLWCAEGILASSLMVAVGRAGKDGFTTRNWATVVKLLALAQS